MLNIALVIGSTRQGRFSEKAADWISTHLAARDQVQLKRLDLRDFQLPFFDHFMPPAMPGRPPFQQPEVQRWTAEIAAADGFIFVTPEYNHSLPAVLKNAIDWVYPEWNRKAAAFVGYGNAGGARSIEHLRAVTTALQMTPVRSTVNLPMSTLMAHFQKGDVDAALQGSNGQVAPMLDDLLWWTQALKTARSNGG